MTLGQQFRVVSIARAVLGRNRSCRRFMAILSAYLDASGSVTDPNCHVFTVAGYLAEDEQWQAFEDDWQEALDDAGVTHLHMKHFVQSKGEFRAWKDKKLRRDGFLERLTGIISKHQLEDFSVYLNMNDYRKVDKRFKITESLGAYAIITAAVIGKIEKWHQRYRSSDSLLFLIEKGDNQQDTLRKLAERTRVWSGQDPQFITKSWKENGIDTYCLPMQASDFLAYEHAKCITDAFTKKKYTSRESLFRVSDGFRGIQRHAQTWTYLNEAFVRLVCQTFNVPMRK